jgi:hypothetical protein
VDEAVDARLLTRIGSWRAALRVVRQDARAQPRQKEPRYWLEEDERGLGPVLIEQSHALAAEWETSRRRRPGYAGDTP